MTTLDQVIAKIQKEYGDRAIRKGEDFEEKERIPTGFMSLDYLLGGGIPKGKIMEFQGPKSSGKSMLSMKAVDQAIKTTGKPAVWVDMEMSWDPTWASQHIDDISMVKVYQIPVAEAAVDAIRHSLTADDPPCIIVLDSIAALSSFKEQERDVNGEQRVGVMASLMALAMRLWTHPADMADCPIIMINQLRDDIGAFSPHGTKEKSPGGRAKEFVSSLIIDIRAGEWKKSGNEYIGRNINVKVMKSKVWGCKPMAGTSLLFYSPCYKPESFCESCTRYCPKELGYFDHVTEAVDLGLELGVIIRKGPYYHFEDLKTQGKEKFMEMVDDEIIERIREKCLDLLKVDV